MVFTKRGYLFIVDAFIALSVLVAAFFIVFTFYSIPSYSFQQQVLAQDIVNYLTTQKVEGYVSTNINLTNKYRQGDIASLQNTIAQEIYLDMRVRAISIGEACDALDKKKYMGCMLMDVVMNEFGDVQHNIAVVLSDDDNTITYYNNSWISPDKANTFVIENHILFVNDVEKIGETDYTRSRIVGPATLSVMVW